MGLLDRITGQNQSAKKSGLLERAKKYRERHETPAAANIPSKKKPFSGR